MDTTTNELRMGDLGMCLTAVTGFSKTALGQPEFMPPEVYEETYGAEVNVYAFGMCMLEIATLKQPYAECASQAQVCRKVRGREREVVNVMLLLALDR